MILLVSIARFGDGEWMQIWQRLGLVEAEQDIHRLYTPAMLADLLGVPVAVIRRWRRREL